MRPRRSRRQLDERVPTWTKSMYRRWCGTLRTRPSRSASAIVSESFFVRRRRLWDWRKSGRTGKSMSPCATLMQAYTGGEPPGYEPFTLKNRVSRICKYLSPTSRFTTANLYAPSTPCLRRFFSAEPARSPFFVRSDRRARPAQWVRNESKYEFRLPPRDTTRRTSRCPARNRSRRVLKNRHHN